MLNLYALKQSVAQIDFREKRTGLYKVLVPFFHEDGDMYDIFIEEGPGQDIIRMSDYGLTLMKLSYAFDIDTENKQEVVQSIVMQNRATYADGQIYLDITPEQFSLAINQFSQVISKVSNMDIISREVQKSMFFEYLKQFVVELSKDYEVIDNFAPTSDTSLWVDYKITRPRVSRPIYLFGVNENAKASRAMISCLTFKAEQILHRSLVIHEDMDRLSQFNRVQLTNIVDKQYANLDGFKERGIAYIGGELTA